jgi:hypothetical protein
VTIRPAIFDGNILAGKSAPEAARVVGYTGSSLADNAKKRSRLPSVRERVAELRALAAEQCVLTIERLIGESEEARLKAMAEKGGASAAISAVQTKAKLAGLWREKVDQHNTGGPVIDRIELVIVDHARRSNDVRPSLSEPRNETENVSVEHAPQSNDVRPSLSGPRNETEKPPAHKPRRHWSE